jgi:HlyD family secretion protein
MTLRVYVSETQLSKIKVGQQVTVKIDTENEMKPNSWISSTHAESTKIKRPKEDG